jgi:hypothetical protein
MHKRNLLHLYIICFFIFIISTDAFGEIYRYVDKNGLWHFLNVKTDSRYRLFIPSSPLKEIFAAQKLLKNLGYYSGKIDGIWGNETEQAIKEYQNRFDLAPTGKLTEETKRHMKIPSEETSPKANKNAKKEMGLPPVAFFQIPFAKKVTVHEPFIRIRAKAKSLGDDKIDNIRVFLNGKPVETVSDIIRDPNGLEASLEIVVPLENVENTITVIASNLRVTSKPEMITVRWEKKEPDFGSATALLRPNLYLVAIGVSEHQDPSYNLEFAHEDAKSIGLAFQNQEGKLYQTVQKRILTNQKATRAEIIDALSWIYRQATQRDLSIIFIAGHGIKDSRGNFYFLPYDGDPDNLMKSAVRWSNFQDIITGMPSKVILMADTCHSGSITGKRRGVSDLTKALKELVDSDAGVVVMTASTGREESQERREWGHGAFTEAIIEGLEGGANYNNDKTIDIKELDLFITIKVKELTDGRQHPTTEIPKTMPNFPLIFTD